MAVLSAIGFWLVIGAPLAVTGLAFLDVARRPAWAWALTGRRQAVWMAVLGGAWITWLGGAAIALLYFATAHREVRDAENGDIRYWIEPDDTDGGDHPPRI